MKSKVGRCKVKECFMGIDIGTTGIKIVLCDYKLSLISSAWRASNLFADRPGWAEGDPERWWIDVCKAVNECLSKAKIKPSNVVAIGTSGMVPVLILLDKKMNILRRSIQQNDARAYLEIKEFLHSANSEEILLRTGSIINQQSLAPKLIWLTRHEPEIFKNICHILGSYDFINFKLTGRLTVEKNWALESGFFDVFNNKWYQEMIKKAEISPMMLPPIISPSDVIGKVTKIAAMQTGLLEGTPVAGGSADHVASALAAGLCDNGDVLVKLGGAGDILYCTDKWATDQRLYIDYHDIPGKFLINGCMASSGSVLKWFVTNFCVDPKEKLGSAYQTLDKLAVKVTPGANGLLVLPYFLGEKTPIFDPFARGVFFGLTLSHTKADIFRAIMEGVAFGFRHHFDIFNDLNFVVKRVLICGGGAKSQIWRKIITDVIGKKVSYIGSHQGSSAGAAFIAGKAVGYFNSWEEVNKLAGVTAVEEPDNINYNRYSQLYYLYRDIYDNLKDNFEKITKIENQYQ